MKLGTAGSIVAGSLALLGHLALIKKQGAHHLLHGQGSLRTARLPPSSRLFFLLLCRSSWHWFCGASARLLTWPPWKPNSNSSSETSTPSALQTSKRRCWGPEPRAKPQCSTKDFAYSQHNTKPSRSVSRYLSHTSACRFTSEHFGGKFSSAINVVRLTGSWAAILPRPCIDHTIGTAYIAHGIAYGLSWATTTWMLALPTKTDHT